MHPIYNVEQAANIEEIPLPFLRSAVGSLKLHIGLVEAGRLGEWLSVPTPRTEGGLDGR